MEKLQIPVALSMSKLGELVGKARQNLRLTYRQLSKVSGVSVGSLQRIEKGAGEHSVSKLFRICVALGIPMSDAISYAVRVESMPELNILNATDVQVGIEWASQLLKTPPAESVEKLSKNAGYLYNLLVETLCGARDTVGLLGNLTSSKHCNDRLESLQILIDSFSNSERLAMLESLIRSPFEKLVALGLFTPEIIMDFLTHEGIWIAEGTAMPDSIQNTLYGVHPTLRGMSAEEIAKKTIRPLTGRLPSDTTSEVLTLSQLLSRLESAAEVHGSLAKLAKALGVPKPSLAAWIARKKKPGCEATLRLLNWVQRHPQGK